MSIFLLKSIIAVFFFVVGVIAVFSMLTLMGKTERKMSATSLRKIHRGAGLAFTLLLFILSYLCLKYQVIVRDQLSLRAILHGFLSLFLIIILIIKLSIVRFYKQFLKFAPTMGITVFALAFVVFTSSAGYFFFRSGHTIAIPERTSAPAQTVLEGNAEKGASLFKSYCATCHYADKETIKIGPGFKGILKKEYLPVSRKTATL
jgi:cytochrome c553